jgi:hypothetical protein
MQITRDQLIVGQPALKVRGFVRTYRLLDFCASEFEKALNLTPEEAGDFAQEMVSLGFLVPSTHPSLDGRPLYQVGDRGHMLVNASAAKPITRKTANSVLQEFMKRVDIVNIRDTYAYTVESVVLFGSMLSDKELLGDVDVALELQHAVPDREGFDQWREYRYCIAMNNGRRFGTTLERLAWPRTEVLLYLKSHSRGLSLHSLEDLVAMDEVQGRIALATYEKVPKREVRPVATVRRSNWLLTLEDELHGAEDLVAHQPHVEPFARSILFRLHLSDVDRVAERRHKRR